MTIEHTLFILKPEVATAPAPIAAGIYNDMAGNGLNLVALERIHVHKTRWEQHYAEHVGKPFYAPLVDHMMSGEVVIGIAGGHNAIAALRGIIGGTDPVTAEPGTIRHRLHRLGICPKMPTNGIHASDSPESAERELDLWFPWRRMLAPFGEPMPIP